MTIHASGLISDTKVLAPYSCLDEFWVNACQRFADFPVLEQFGMRLTYQSLERLIEQFATYLQHLNLNKTQRLAIMLPNCIQYYVALFAGLRLGLTIVNINPLYTSYELLQELSDAEPSAIVILANFLGSLAPIRDSVPSLRHVVVTEIGDLLPIGKRFVFHCITHYVKKQIPRVNLPGVVRFRSALKHGSRRTFKSVEVTLEDVAFLQYTGGTTGVAKGAVLTHRNIIANMAQAVVLTSSVGLKPGQEVGMVALPLYHIFSLLVCGFCFIEMGVMGVLIANPRDLPGLIKIASRHTFTLMVGVNTLFSALLHHKDFPTHAFRSLKLTISGGMATSKAVADSWELQTASPITQGYGLTEASPVVLFNPPNLTPFNGSAGLPVMATELSVRNEAGEILPVGEAGELWVRGPQVMRGYWHRPDETAKVLTPDGWLKTGDIMRQSPDGFFYLVDRKKDMIVVSGFKVYPNEVELVLSQHPLVSEACVIGIPDVHSGEAVKAYVVPVDASLEVDALLRFCGIYLTRYKIPKVIQFVSELPKSSVGKVLRRTLRQQENMK